MRRTRRLAPVAAFVLVLIAALAGLRVASADDTRDKRASRAAIERWVSELRHPELARREAATRELIAAGDVAARRVRALCDAPEPALAYRALRIYGAVFGVTPEEHDRAREILGEALRGDLDAPSAADALRDISPAAEILAMRELAEDKKKDAPAHPLWTELRVRRAMERIRAGADRDDREHRAVLAQGTAAAPSLLRIARDGDRHRATRSYALWLYSLVTGRERGAGLRPLLVDRDPVLREEAILAVSETIRANDLAGIATTLGTAPSTARDRLAEAAARRLELDDLADPLDSKRAEVASFAALAIGKFRDPDGQKMLADQLKGEKRDTVREAIATGLGEYADDDSVDTLANLYARDRSAAVRGAAVTALRSRTDHRKAAIVLASALFDADEGVRLLAADGMALGSSRDGAPALIRAALADSSSAVRARALAGLAELVPDGPTAGATTAEAARSWDRWLSRNDDSFESDDLPWFADAADAQRIYRRIRDHVSRNFFYFDEKERVEADTLSGAAIQGMKKLFQTGDDAPKDPLGADGFERRLLERLLDAPVGRKPATFLAALGTIPFETDRSDLIRLTNAATLSLVGSLGDRFSRLQLSNDPEGKIRPNWLPGLLDDNDKTNGFTVEQKDDAWWVDFVLFDSSAYYAGIRPGDQLVKVGKKFTTEMERTELRKSLNTEADFHILREGWNRPYAFSLTPTKDDTKRVVIKALLPGNIGYLRLKAFEAACSVSIEQALVELEREGMVGLVFDLRNNPGGTVVDATEIVDKFLPSGKIITINETRQRGSDETDDEIVRSTDAESDRDYPLAILINRSSASASEMTSGSLQGNERATIIGETSFGKGIGQSGIQVPGFTSKTALGTTQSAYALSLTMMRYYIPENRRSIHLVGVEPDLAVRERTPRGSLQDKIMRVRNGKDLDKYVTRLLEEHADAAVALARFDGEQFAEYPEFDGYFKKVRRHVDEDEARRIARAEIRRRLLQDRDRDDYASLLYDLQEDRTLRAGIRTVAEEAGVDLDSIEEYKIW